MRAGNTKVRPARKYRRTHNRWEPLSARIAAHASLLMEQGDLVLKKIGTHRYWYLRFLLPANPQGQRRHCSLYVGREADRELVARVLMLLEQIREPKHQLNEIARYVQFMTKLCRALQLTARTLGRKPVRTPITFRAKRPTIPTPVSRSTTTHAAAISFDLG